MKHGFAKIIVMFKIQPIDKILNDCGEFNDDFLLIEQKTLAINAKIDIR